MILIKPQPQASHLSISIQPTNNSQPPQHEQPEEIYLDRLRQQLLRCHAQLQYHQSKYLGRINAMQEQMCRRQMYHQLTKAELRLRIESLQAQNDSLKQKLSKLYRGSRRQSMGKAIQADKVARLTKIISQKQAVIKYLQQKNSTLQHTFTEQSSQRSNTITLPKYSTKSKSHHQNYNSSDNNGDGQSFSVIERDTLMSNQRSFAKLIKNMPTFGDYNHNNGNHQSVQLHTCRQQDGQRQMFGESTLKNKRTKTQSIQNNQNKNHNNHDYYIKTAAQQLKSLLNHANRDALPHQKQCQTTLTIDPQPSRQSHLTNVPKTCDLSRNYTSNKSLSSWNPKNVGRNGQTNKKGFPYKYMICHSDLHGDGKL